MNHAYLYHGGTRLDELLNIFVQAPAATQPCERSFDDPTLGKMDKSTHTFGATHNMQSEIGVFVHPPIQFIIVILVISIDGSQSWKRLRIDLGKQLLGSNGVVHGRRCDQDRQQHSHGIHENMTLAAADFLAAVV